LLAYTMGLKNQVFPVPSVIKDLLAKSQKQSSAPKPKKVTGTHFVHESGMKKLTNQELAAIKEALAQIPSSRLALPVLDAVKSRKVGGGSSGLLRFQVLVGTASDLRHLEFKQLVEPAMESMKTSPIPPQAERIRHTLKLTQEDHASSFYAVTQVNGLSMLIRPRFAGNEGFELQSAGLQLPLESHPLLQALDDNQQVITYEAYTLGRIHSRSVKSDEDWLRIFRQITPQEWSDSVEAMKNLYLAKFKQLKQRP
jgi:hypothetical protein